MIPGITDKKRLPRLGKIRLGEKKENAAGAHPALALSQFDSWFLEQAGRRSDWLGMARMLDILLAQQLDEFLAGRKIECKESALVRALHAGYYLFFEGFFQFRQA